jgi:hypothetical protein
LISMNFNFIGTFPVASNNRNRPIIPLPTVRDAPQGFIIEMQ